MFSPIVEMWHNQLHVPVSQDDDPSHYANYVYYDLYYCLLWLSEDYHKNFLGPPASPCEDAGNGGNGRHFIMPLPANPPKLASENLSNTPKVGNPARQPTGAIPDTLLDHEGKLIHPVLQYPAQ